MSIPQSGQYDFDNDECPTCFVQVWLVNPADGERFLKVVADFALQLKLQARPSPITEDGRQLPAAFESVDFFLRPSVFEFPNPATNYAQVSFRLLSRSYPHERFTSIANGFIATMRAAFGAQVRIAGTD